MSLSKTLTSAVAAVTVAGAVGLAYAQSTSDTSPAPAPAPATCRHEPAGEQHGAAGRHQQPCPRARPTTTDNVVVRLVDGSRSRRPTATRQVDPRPSASRSAGPGGRFLDTMKFIPEGELRSDLLAGLKQGVLVAAGALVLTLPPAGLATLRAPPPSAVAVAPIDRSGPFRSADFGSHPASADARFVADWVADSGDSKGLPYLILDKRDARLYRLRRPTAA